MAPVGRRRTQRPAVAERERVRICELRLGTDELKSSVVELRRPVVAGSGRGIGEKARQSVESARVRGVPLGLGGNARIEIPRRERLPLPEQIVRAGYA